MNWHMPIHQKSGDNFDFVLIPFIYFVLPLPWRSQSTLAQDPATKGMCLLLTKRGPVGGRMSMCEPQGGLYRVEESKPGSFLSLLIWGRKFGTDLFPRCNSSGSDQGASQQSSSSWLRPMLSPCLFYLPAHTAPDPPPALNGRGPCLHVSLGQFN